MTIYKGTIEGFGGSFGSGLGFLQISGVPIPCDNGATVRALNACFGDVIGEGHTIRRDGGHVGREVYYSTDDFGLLSGFTPVDDAPEALVQEYESQFTPKRRKGVKKNAR